MATPAQELINAAFSMICQTNGLTPDPKAFEWTEGEAERWLRDIASGRVRLGYSPNYEQTAYHPCLREVGY